MIDTCMASSNVDEDSDDQEDVGRRIMTIIEITLQVKRPCHSFNYWCYLQGERIFSGSNTSSLWGLQDVWPRQRRVREYQMYITKMELELT